MVIKQKFRTTSDAIATYDFFDLTNNIGYVVFYGSKQEDSTGDVYNLDRTKHYSTANETVVQGGGTSTINFDITFIKPFVIDGDAFINAAHESIGGSSTTKLDFSLYHYDGSTETQLGSTISVGVTAGSGSLETLKIAIDNQLFKAGETLRLKVFFDLGAIGNSTYAHLWHDPLELYSPSTGIPASQLNIAVPIKIQQ